MNTKSEKPPVRGASRTETHRTFIITPSSQMSRGLPTIFSKRGSNTPLFCCQKGEPKHPPVVVTAIKPGSCPTAQEGAYSRLWRALLAPDKDKTQGVDQ